MSDNQFNKNFSGNCIDAIDVEAGCGPEMAPGAASLPEPACLLRPCVPVPAPIRPYAAALQPVFVEHPQLLLTPVVRMRPEDHVEVFQDALEEPALPDSDDSDILPFAKAGAPQLPDFSGWSEGDRAVALGQLNGVFAVPPPLDDEDWELDESKLAQEVDEVNIGAREQEGLIAMDEHKEEVKEEKGEKRAESEDGMSPATSEDNLLGKKEEVQGQEEATYTAKDEDEAVAKEEDVSNKHKPPKVKRRMGLFHYFLRKRSNDKGNKKK